MLRQSLTIVGLGLATGMGAALLSTRALESVLRGIAYTDPPTLRTVVMLLAIIGALALCSERTRDGEALLRVAAERDEQMLASMY